MLMTAHEAGIPDIFDGAEKVETLGKLPLLLWAYIDTARTLVASVRTQPEASPSVVSSMIRLLGALNSAADHLENKDLKDRLTVHAEMLGALTNGNLSTDTFIETITPGLATLEDVAGPRPRGTDANLLLKDLVEREIERSERVKTGRSADIIVSVDILEDIRNFLLTEAMTEGITSLLVIDNAGTLIVNIGSKPDLDAVSLAAVAAANFAATEQIARLIGENEFTLLFYKGHNESFHFSRVGTEYIIVTIFNNSLSLGLLRLKMVEIAQGLDQKLPKREA
jgi:predicted regulator of Ras-like GTPase activity (Roadblock/LC7/MglB family)